MSKRILLVDDDPVIRLLVGDYLRALGHEVEEAEGGRACLSKLDELTPEILVLDLLMPDLNGLEVLKSVRQHPKIKFLPVILLSANAEIKEIAAREEVEADLYLLKPFEMNALKLAVEKLSL